MPFDDVHATKVYDIAPTLMYIPTSIPSSELEEEYFQDFNGCECTECNDACPCVQKSGGYFKDGILYKTEVDKPIYECHTECSCASTCKLRRMQFGPIDCIEVLKARAKGDGLFATEDIPKGRFICEYAGEYVTEDDALTRYNDYKDDSRINYIFWLKEHFGDKTYTTIIDPTRIGNIGRFINHSCEPNCELVPIRMSNIFPKLCVFTNRNVTKGEELSFDYGCNESGLITDAKVQQTKCSCNTKTCKGVLPLHATS